jgi:predicted metalloprotease
MRFNPKARIDESQVENRGGGGGFGGGLGGGGMRLPIPTGGGGKAGLGGFLVILLLVVLTQCMGNDIFSSNAPDSSTQGTQGSTSCRTGADANASEDCAVDLITNSVQNYWAQAYDREIGQPYQDIKTIKFSGSTSSGCGQASSATGPFYCPNDQRVYLDLTFFQQMLQGRLGAKGGPFAEAYVVAHEYGHHIENLLGIMGRVRSTQGENSDSVKLELMADCLAGAWAKHAQETDDASGQPLISDLTQQDIDDALDSASAVGDDRIQKRSGGRVNPESWTHGSAAQRKQAFGHGLKNGTIEACNLF